MKLIYLYIENYGILKDIEFNFDSEYKFEYDRVNNELKEITVPNPKLTDNFFSINSKDNPVVDSISALIGGNGAGKTTVASFFHDLNNVPNNLRNTKYIFIYETDILHRKTNIEDLNIKIKKEFQVSNDHEYNRSAQIFVESIEAINSNFKYKFIYCSNAYNPQHVYTNSRDDNFIDLSTTGLLWKGYSLNRHTEQSVDGYNQTMLNWQIEFLAYYDELISNKPKEELFSLPVPHGIFISVNENLIDSYEKNIKDTESEWLETIKKINELTLNDKILKIYWACLIDILNYLDSRLNNLSNDKKKYIYIQIENLCKELGNSGNNKETIFKEKFNNISTEVEIYKEKIDQLFSIVDDVESNKWDILNPFFNINFSEQKDKIIDFVNMYFGGPAINRYLRFCFDPMLSAGEYAQYNLYSRLYRLLCNPPNNGFPQITDKDKNIIIFFDEIEITEHPSLQLDIVSNVIKFFEMFYTDKKIHIVFATHSPIILSDIPKSNTIFLKRTKDDIVEINEQSELNNTFAANIHSLYRYPYFMEDGTIGKFAERTINELIKKIKRIRKNSKMKTIFNIQNQIDLIGEPLIRNKLSKMLENKVHISNKDNLIEYYKKKIKDLEKNKND